MKILNLYAGIGGNRKSRNSKHEITAVEKDPKIAAIYKDLFPRDKIIIGDAHEYRRTHFQEFDFIWSSPHRRSHSDIRQNLGVRFSMDVFRATDYLNNQEISGVIRKRHNRWLFIMTNKKGANRLDLAP